MSKKSPITVSSWTLVTSALLKNASALLKKPVLKVSASVLKRMSMPWLKAS